MRALGRGASRPALLLAGVVVAAVVLRVYLNGRIPTPHVLPDEVIYADMADRIASGSTPGLEGRPPNVLYPLLLAPAWLADSPSTSYTIAKGLNACLAAATAVPVYLWGRRLMAPSWALLAAVLCLLVPGLDVTMALLTENVAYPAFVLACFATALALERPTAGRQLLAIAAIALAAAARLQLLVLVVLLPVALVVDLVLERRAGGERPRTRLRRFWPTAVVFAAGALAYVALRLAQGASLRGGLGSYEGVAQADYSLAEIGRWALWHAGGLVFAVGIVPATALVVVTALAWRTATPSERAFVSVAITACALVLVQVGALVPRFLGGWVTERYTFQLAPLLLLALAAWAARGVPLPPGSTAIGLALPAALLLSVPLERVIGPTLSANSLAFGALPRLAAKLGGGMGDVRLLLAAGLLAVAVFLLRAPRPVVAAALPLAVGVFFVVASKSVFGAMYAEALSRATYAAGPERSWIDQAIGPSAGAAYLFAARPDVKQSSEVLMEAGFWNRSLREVYHLDTGAIDPLPDRVAKLDVRTGRIELGGPSRPYVVTHRDLPVVGRVVAQQAATVSPLALYRVVPPLRLAARLDGVYGDGWTGASASLTQYATARNRPGRLRIEIARPWTGADLRTSVTIRVVRVGSGSAPAVARGVVETTRPRTFVLPTPRPPFRAQIDVARTFSPADFGQTDARQLGVQLGLRLLPARSSPEASRGARG